MIIARRGDRFLIILLLLHVTLIVPFVAWTFEIHCVFDLVFFCSKIFHLISSGVHLGDDDVLVVGVLLSEFVPGRGELFAVTAPRCVELDQHVLWLIASNLNNNNYLILGNLKSSATQLGDKDSCMYCVNQKSSSFEENKQYRNVNERAWGIMSRLDIEETMIKSTFRIEN